MCACAQPTHPHSSRADMMFRFISYVVSIAIFFDVVCVWGLSAPKPWTSFLSPAKERKQRTPPLCPLRSGNASLCGLKALNLPSLRSGFKQQGFPPPATLGFPAHRPRRNTVIMMSKSFLESGERITLSPFPFKLYTLYFNLFPIAVRRRCVRHRRCCVRRRSLRSGLRPMNGWASRNSCWASRTNGSGCSCCCVARWTTTSGWASCTCCG